MINQFEIHKIQSRNRFILETILKNKPKSVSKLCSIMGLSCGTTIYRYLYPLQQEGLISFKRSKNTRGNPNYIQLTKKGIKEIQAKTK